MKITKTGTDSAIIVPGDKIDVTNSHDFKKTLLELFEEGINSITIDFSDVKTLDSSGLGKLLLFHKKIKERQGTISITNVKDDYIRKTFNLIHLEKVINID